MTATLTYIQNQLYSLFEWIIRIIHDSWSITRHCKLICISCEFMYVFIMYTLTFNGLFTTMVDQLGQIYPFSKKEVSDNFEVLDIGI